MVEEAITSEQVTEEEPKETVGVEPSKVKVQVYMPVNMYEEIKDCAEYAAIEGLIESHPRGNISEFCNWCLNLGVAQIKQYMLKKRGYR